MTTMIREIYEAFKEAGASEDKSSAAAEAIANYEDRTSGLRQHMDERFSAIDQKITAHDGRFTLLQWMLGFNLAISAAVLIAQIF